MNLQERFNENNRTIEKKKIKIQNLLIEMASHQPFLSLPKKLPESFGVAITEVQKRTSFNTYFFYFCEKLKNVCKEERE